MSLKVKGQYDDLGEWISDLEFYLNKVPSDIQEQGTKEYVVLEKGQTVAYWDRVDGMGWIEKE